MGMGMAPGGGLGNGVDAKAGWVDNTRPQPSLPLPPPEAQPRRPEPAPQRARLEVASEGEPGALDSRVGGDLAPSGGGDPPKPERKGPEMPRLFLDLGPPQGNSEQIKGEEAAGSMGVRLGASGAQLSISGSWVADKSGWRRQADTLEHTAWAHIPSSVTLDK